MNTKRKKRISRHKKVRARIKGTKDVPRVCVFRSNRYISAQVVDDNERKTVLSISTTAHKTSRGNASKPSKNSKNPTGQGTKTGSAMTLGKELGALAKKAGIEKIVFDRAGYKYHGRVKAFADGLRESGLIF
jgi:large subunit ribosomal protein L18